MASVNREPPGVASPTLDRLRKQSHYRRLRVVVTVVAWTAVLRQTVRALDELGRTNWIGTTALGVAGALFEILWAILVYAVAAFIARALVMAFLDLVDGVVELRLRSAVKDGGPG